MEKQNLGGIKQSFSENVERDLITIPYPYVLVYTAVWNSSLPSLKLVAIYQLLSPLI